MVILLTPDQIPELWDSIKFAAVNADYVDERFREAYLNRLLYQLLSSKAQCFIRLGNDRRLQAIAITRIELDEIRDEKSLFVACLYSFVKVDDETWIKSIEVLKNYAKRNECKAIVAWSTSDKVSALISIMGMKKRFESFTLEV